ncbi:BON domain-containing protein [Ralstonia sp. L16]|uniref:BON domain-containing protein n=1 Tax=Ralstonia TaxID=48736 RepID=UPI001E3B62CA|nr:BON domain-containing protein [Ralstonia wenshanensis]UGS90747.1 BON domain-containing protein [Ralstonia wenshanensis]
MKLSSPTFARFRRTVTRTAVLAALAGVTATQLTACFPLFAGAVAGGVALATDRRPTATQTIDRGLQMEAENTLISRYDGRAHVNVTVYNRKVLLTGEAGTEQTKQEIGQYAQKLQNAREVVNELVVTPESSTFGSRTNDTYITTKVKSVLAGTEGVPWNSIKVTTEAQTVFLMGVVTEAEGNKATEAVRTVSGVNKVVKVFDYVSEDERKRLDANATSTNPSTAPDASQGTPAPAQGTPTATQAPAPVTSASPGVTVSPTNSPALPPGKQLP